MKLPISPGQYLFCSGLVYFVVGMFDIFVYHFCETEYIQMAWMLVLLIPVLVPMRKFVRNTPFWRA